MGYDLYWIDPPDNDAALIAARDQFEAAVKFRDQFARNSEAAKQAQVRVSAAYDAISAAQPEYFRLNIWGMGSTREAMDAIGMLCTPVAPTSEEWDEVNTLVSDMGEEADTEAVYRRILSSHRGECPGIPWWKLSDNSGWYVLPAEIRSALHIYLTKRKEGMEPPPLEWWGEWIEWLGAAAEHGGFRVW